MTALERIERWFGTYGWRPFEFQRDTWAAYRAGESGLVHAPTGMGKTYAVWMGPLFECLEAGGQAGVAAVPTRRGRAGARRSAPPLRVLWITPLRALASDTAASLQAPVRELGLNWTVELRTGDTSAALRARQRERLPTVLITTPESLSLQLSYADARERLGSVECVIVDEWHELLGTKRGVQTELALARLRTWNPALQTWGLSATLGNIDEAMDVLLGVGADGRRVPGRMIRGYMPKGIEVVTLCPRDVERFPWAGHLGMKLLDDVIAAIERARSTLLFTNTRSQAELWFQGILRARPDLIGQIALHHGSLDRELRGRVEAMIGDGRLRCVVCTSSLDLGVDFTPVDQVIQVGSPKGVARLMQRAGRSGHQPGAVSRILCVPTHAFELVEFAAARDAIAAGRIESRLHPDRPLDVLVQHLVTVALGGGFTRDALYAEVRRTRAFAGLTPDEWGWCIDFVTRGGPALELYPQFARVVERDGRFVVESNRVARLHRLSIGTITSDTAMTVRTVRGSKLGTIEESFIARLHPGERFVFAGRVLELARVHEMTAYVRRVAQSVGRVPRWQGGRMPLSSELAEAVRAKLLTYADHVAAGDAQTGGPDEIEFAAVRPLIALQAEWSIVPGPDDLLIETSQSREGHHLFVFPFEGRLVHEGLAPLVAYRISRRRPISISVSATDYGFEMLSHEPLELTEADWRGVLAPEGLLDDLLACLNATQLARRQFRDIARIAGLVFQGYPGAARTTRQLQASSELFYQVLREYDPGNLLLDQARREVLETQLEVRRLRATLERLAGMRLRIVPTERLTPLAFPIWAERLRSEHLSSEKWSERIRRMVVRLERAAEPRAARRRRSRRADVSRTSNE